MDTADSVIWSRRAIVTMFDVFLDQYRFKGEETGKTTARRRVDTLLDGLDDRELFLIEEPAKGLHKLKELPVGAI